MTRHAAEASAILTRHMDTGAATAFQQSVAALFDETRELAAEARLMPYSDGARLLAVRFEGFSPIAQEVLVLAMLAEMQDLAARLPA